MKLVLFILAFLSLSVLAAPDTTQVMMSAIDYLRGTPASVSGTISFDEDVQLYKTKKAFVDVGLKVNQKRGIGFQFSENHLYIGSEDGLSISIGGIPVKVNSISYNDTTAAFQVKTSTPLGIAEGTVNEQIEKVLNEQYKPKVIKAFQELKTLRSKESLNDANKVITSIVGIFSNGKAAAPLPTIRGNVELNFYTNTDKTFKLNDWKGEVKAGDNVSLAMDFVKQDKKITVGAVDVKSNQGIRLSGKTSFPEIASVNFRQLRADQNGIHFEYDIGAEEVLTGFKLLLEVVKTQTGQQLNLADCDPIKLQPIRKKIDENLKVQLAVMIQKNRQMLLNAGASPQLLAALE